MSPKFNSLVSNTPNNEPRETDPGQDTMRVDDDEINIIGETPQDVRNLYVSMSDQIN